MKNFVTSKEEKYKPLLKYVLNEYFSDVNANIDIEGFLDKKLKKEEHEEIITYIKNNLDGEENALDIYVNRIGEKFIIISLRYKIFLSKKNDVLLVFEDLQNFSVDKLFIRKEDKYYLDLSIIDCENLQNLLVYTDINTIFIEANNYKNGKSNKNIKLDTIFINNENFYKQLISNTEINKLNIIDIKKLEKINELLLKIEQEEILKQYNDLVLKIEEIKDYIENSKSDLKKIEEVKSKMENVNKKLVNFGADLDNYSYLIKDYKKEINKDKEILNEITNKLRHINKELEQLI